MSRPGQVAHPCLGVRLRGEVGGRRGGGTFRCRLRVDGSRGHESEKHVPSAATESVTQTERAAVPSGAAFGWGPDGDGQAETGPDGGIPAGGEDREASAGLGVRRLSCVGLPIVGGRRAPSALSEGRVARA